MPPLLRLRLTALGLPSALTAADLDFRRRIVRVIIALGGALVLGTAGYMALEHWRLLDALYMTVITLCTVGLTAVHPLSGAGHLFTIALIATGVSTAAYAVGAIGEYVIGGRFSGTIRRRRMQHDIDRLESHYIVCGYGRVGRQVVAELAARRCRTVVIEPSDDVLAEDDDPGPLYAGRPAAHRGRRAHRPGHLRAARGHPARGRRPRGGYPRTRRSRSSLRISRVIGAADRVGASLQPARSSTSAVSWSTASA